MRLQRFQRVITAGTKDTKYGGQKLAEKNSATAEYIVHIYIYAHPPSSTAVIVCSPQQRDAIIETSFVSSYRTRSTRDQSITRVILGKRSFDEKKNDLTAVFLSFKRKKKKKDQWLMLLDSSGYSSSI